MNRNVESHFSELPQIDIQRSMFDRSSSHKTSFNVGQLIPFYIDEVLPGDTFNVKTSCVVRLQTPLTPIMDNMYLDTYYFFVPNRIVWEHWKEFMGENTSSPWIPSTTYTIPTISTPLNGWNKGTIADYLGIPIGVENSLSLVALRGISALPFRGYAKIADEFFRDQNLTDPLNIPYGDTTVTGSNGTNYITDTAKGGAPFVCAKYHDYFTSCLPAPQKSAAIGLFGNLLPLGLTPNVFNSYVPVVPRDTSVYGLSVPTTVNQSLTMHNDAASTKAVTRASGSANLKWDTVGASEVVMTPDNLWANVGQMNLSINQLRLAFQLQKFYEKNARAGTRYREVLKEHFGVTSSDARMMIPEYLGGHRFPLVIHQIANQSAANSGDYLGDLGAMSNTSDIHEDFIKSFEEHGFVFGLCVVRYDHSYPQGLERFWRRSVPTDYYFPVFANIGEQPVYQTEIYFDNTQNGEEVFGYQEAWAEYRYKPSRVSGEMRPGISNSLATWHLADYYTSIPALSDGWIREDLSNVDRVLSVAHNAADQVFADFYVKNICTRPMPMYSVPGLIDHH